MTYMYTSDNSCVKVDYYNNYSPVFIDVVFVSCFILYYIYLSVFSSVFFNVYIFAYEV